MEALIFENKVVDIAEVSFEVHSSLTWMDCSNDCKVGWIIEGGVLTAPPEPPEPTYEFKRMQGYPSVGDQLDMMMKDMRDGTTTHQTACEAVKAKFPKPE